MKMILKNTSLTFKKVIEDYGRELFNPSYYIAGKTIAAGDGKIVDNAMGYSVYAYIPVYPNATYRISVKGRNAGYSVRIWDYDENNDPVSNLGELSGALTNYIDITTSSSAKSISMASLFTTPAEDSASIRRIG